MAGNIVKWWKHKFLGGYKQFSVLQECPTDSEENVIPVRAPSTCSAPPDLVLINDKEIAQQSQNSSNSTSLNGIHKNKENYIKTQYITSAVNDRTQNNHKTRRHNFNERMQVEEFTCDVSVEGDKSSQPVQFSFTFYDLDGHHGKITKDDIAGIVYTIYDAIGKSVVVPHCGSKTINVRLTVSPEGKTKSDGNIKKSMPSALPPFNQRQSHHRTKKAVKSDNEEDEVNSSSEKDIPTYKRGMPTAKKIHKFYPETTSEKICCSELRTNNYDNESPADIILPTTINGGHASKQEQATNCKFQVPDNIYESITNLKYSPKESHRMETLNCKDCIDNSYGLDQNHIHHAKACSNVRIKLPRGTRKQKHQEEYFESRRRSLSVGNESCWKLRTRAMMQGDHIENTTVPAECWKNALKRNDLIDIIRESMEKNRLCFKSNGKSNPIENSTRHRQRSHTISRIANDNCGSPQTSHNSTMLQKQFTLNPAFLMQNNDTVQTKTNLCGYDSFLHATICTPSNNSSNSTFAANHFATNSPKHFTNCNNLRKTSKQHRNGYYSQQNSPQFQGYQRLSSTQGMHKLNTSLLNSINPQMTTEEKLNRTIFHVEKWLNEKEQTAFKINDLKNNRIEIDEKLKKDEKNYDHLLNAKLDEKLIDSPKKITNNNMRRIQHNYGNYEKQQQKMMEANNHSGSEHIGQIKSKFATMIPIKVHPDECENLIHATSDEDILSSTSNNGDRKSSRGDGESCSSNANSNWKNSSASTIHRYVHEHIHHHYHHFEDKED